MACSHAHWGWAPYVSRQFHMSVADCKGSADCSKGRLATNEE